jgi:hypothetical protein
LVLFTKLKQAFFKIHRKSILAIDDFMDFTNFFKKTMGLTLNWELLMKTTRTLFCFPSINNIKRMQKSLVDVTKAEYDQSYFSSC